MTVVVVSGGFDPIHSGHIQLLENAAELGSALIVGLNSDDWLQRKKGRAFMPFEERKAILSAIRCVTEVIQFDDRDDTACHLLERVRGMYGPDRKIIFANGGDRTSENIPEMTILDIEFVFGVGGNYKANSSSWVLENWEKQRTETRWGYYDVLDDTDPQCKVKTLSVKPGGCLTYQKHEYRSELWFIKSGRGKIIHNNTDAINHTTDNIKALSQSDHFFINKGEWHQLINDSRTEELVIVEIQHGEKCVEEDITSE